MSDAPDQPPVPDAAPTPTTVVGYPAAPAAAPAAAVRQPGDGEPAGPGAHGPLPRRRVPRPARGARRRPRRRAWPAAGPSSTTCRAQVSALSEQAAAAAAAAGRPAAAVGRAGGRAATQLGAASDLEAGVAMPAGVDSHRRGADRRPRCRQRRRGLRRLPVPVLPALGGGDRHAARGEGPPARIRPAHQAVQPRLPRREQPDADAGRRLGPGGAARRPASSTTTASRRSSTSPRRCSPRPTRASRRRSSRAEALTELATGGGRVGGRPSPASRPRATCRSSLPRRRPGSGVASGGRRRSS